MHYCAPTFIELRELYLSPNNSKVDSMEIMLTVIAHLFPLNDQESCIHTMLFKLEMLKIYCHYFIYRYNLFTHLRFWLLLFRVKLINLTWTFLLECNSVLWGDFHASRPKEIVPVICFVWNLLFSAFSKGICGEITRLVPANRSWCTPSLKECPNKILNIVRHI